MKVPVMFSRGSMGEVTPEELDELLVKDAVLAIHRADRWVIVGVDLMRIPGDREGSSWKNRKTIHKQQR